MNSFLSLFFSIENIWLLYSVCILWFVFEALFVFVLTLKMKKEHKTIKKRDTPWLFLSILVIICLAFSLAYLSMFIGIWLIQVQAFYIGLVIMISGIAFREWAVITLSKHVYTATNDSKLISSGPYSLVRHPAYGGSLIVVIGLALSLRSLITLLAMLAISCPILYRRAKNEERLLEQEFGEQYVAYRKKVKRMFIPYLL